MSRVSSESGKRQELLQDSFRRVEELLAQQLSLDDALAVPGPFARSLLLDAAKIALQCELVGIEDESIAAKKIRYARQAIMLDPENAELWVHLHLCLTSGSPEDTAMRAKSIFRAYQLDPEQPFVQEHLLKHYMSSPKTYSRAFHMILRTTQQQQAEQIQNNQSAVTLPIVTAVLAFLNAKAYFGCRDLAQRRAEKKQQLLEAISLVSLIGQRDDLVQMFQSLHVFLQHQKGDYLQTIKYLEQLIEDSQGDALLRLMLIESYMGVKVHPTQAALLRFFEESAAHETLQAEETKKVTGKARGLLHLADDDAQLKSVTETLISEFSTAPRQVSSALILHQEMCLSRGLLPEANVLDLAEDVMPMIEQLELPDQRMLLVQSLTFCQIRDGEIQSKAVIHEAESGEVVEQNEEGGKDYLRYLVKASRIKPKTIDSIQTQKDLLSAKLASHKHP